MAVAVTIADHATTQSHRAARTEWQAHPCTTATHSMATTRQFAVACTALHGTALHCAAPHCTALHCTALHCTQHDMQVYLFVPTYLGRVNLVVVVLVGYVWRVDDVHSLWVTTEQCMNHRTR